MAVNTAFSFSSGTNQKIATSGTSQSVTIDKHSLSVRLVNIGANPCHVRIGSGAQTATTSDFVMAANTQIVVTKADGHDTVAALQITGTTDLYVQPGSGKL